MEVASMGTSVEIPIDTSTEASTGNSRVSFHVDGSWKLPLLQLKSPLLPLLPWKLASMEANPTEVNGRFHRKLPRQLLLEASTTSIGTSFASMEASRSLHRFRGSFHLQRSSLPCALEASVEAMDASMEPVENFHFLRG